MERLRSTRLSRRRLLRRAVVATVPTALLKAHPAAARTQAVDYPPAQSHPASTSNYTSSDRPSSYPLDHVVIHVTQESYADALMIFQDPTTEVSAHYVVRSRDGLIAQCVPEHDIAWHAGNWDYNTRSIGIEHEGWVDRPEFFTNELYRESARLAATICTQYGIPIDRRHIIGHSEVPSATHTDPGPYWDWDTYIGLVSSAALRVR